MLAELLGDPARLGQPVGPEVLDEARLVLEHAAGSAGCWTPDEPLRLAKASVARLLQCPRRALADPDLVDMGDVTNIVLGQVVDAGAKLATLGPARPPTVAAACEYLDAIGETRVGDHLLDVGDEAAAELLAEAASRLDPLVAAWPTIDPRWWPRVEEPVRMRLAGGAVVVSGKLDVLLGGPPTGLPGLVVELKGGQWHDSVRQDGHLYALLVGLRDGVAPAAVLSIAAADGATQLEPIRPEVILHAAERVATAVGTAAHLAAGEPPEAHPGSYCTFCPLRPPVPRRRPSRPRHPMTSTRDAVGRADLVRRGVAERLEELAGGLAADADPGDVYVGWVAAADVAGCPTRYRAGGVDGWGFPGWSPALAAGSVGKVALARHLDRHVTAAATAPALPHPLEAVKAWMREARATPTSSVAEWVTKLTRQGDRAALAATAALATRWIAGFVRVLGCPRGWCWWSTTRAARRPAAARPRGDRSWTHAASRSPWPASPMPWSAPSPPRAPSTCCSTGPTAATT